MQVSTNNSRLLDKTAKEAKLRGIAKDVFSIICTYPGLTAGEIWRKYLEEGGDTYRGRNEIAKRITDLANWGAVKGDGLTLCPESGRAVTRWVTTGALPDKTKKVRKASTADGAGVSDRFLNLQNLNKSLMAQRDKAEETIGIVEARARDAESQRDNLRSQVVIATNAKNQAETDAIRARQDLHDVRQALRDFGQNAVQLEGAELEFVRKVTKDQGFAEPKRAVVQAIRTYQLFTLGELVQRRKFVEEMKTPVGVQSLALLRQLQSRNNLILKFRRFLPKRLFRQADETAKALAFAISYMTQEPETPR